MSKLQNLLRRLAMLPVLCSSLAMAAVVDTAPVPPMLTHEQLYLPGLQPIVSGVNGEAVWITSAMAVKSMSTSSAGCAAVVASKRSWDPATGRFSDTPIKFEGGYASAQAVTPDGMLFLATSLCKDTAGDAQIVLLSPSGKVVSAPMAQKFLQPRLVMLSEKAMAVLERDEKTRHIKVDLVRIGRGGVLSVERMPELEVPLRNVFSEAGLPGGRLMILGGSDDQYRGCMACRANTHILDPKTKTWSAGPPMLEPRAEHLATALPDGSILVTGGWTPTQGWGHGPSRTAERWNPASNRFEAASPMPSGTSRHRAVWMPGRTGKTLLIAGGLNPSVFAYDVASGDWRSAGAFEDGSEEGGCVFVPFALNGNLYAWGAFRSEGFYSSKSCVWQAEWKLIALRNPADSATPMPGRMKILSHGGAALVMATPDKPFMSIGGFVHAGMNSYPVTAAVEAVDVRGAAWTLPSLREPRSGANAFRLSHGIVVMGGRGEDSSDSRTGARTLPMEWLATEGPGDKAHWVIVAGDYPSGTLSQQADGSLFRLDNTGTLSRFKPVFGAGGTPAWESVGNEFPPLNRVRGDARENGHERVQMLALADGRVIVAGGSVVGEKIAQFLPDSNQPDAADNYRGMGNNLPSRWHEIYDPISKRWRDSVPSRGAGGKVAILPNGRVLKIGRLSRNDENDKQYVLELSNAEGTSWTTFAADASKIILKETTTPFVVEGELFLSGEMQANTNGAAPSELDWLNTTSGRWEMLWQAGKDDNPYTAEGRVIVRQLANGKRVVLPVRGF